MPATVTSCDKNLVHVNPCLSCLSEKELLALLVVILSRESDYTLPTDTGKLMKDSACLTCFSDKQLLQALVNMFGDEFLSERDTEASIRNAITCLSCAAPAQLKAAFVYLLCRSDLLSQET